MTDLMLDTRNPRHQPVKTQREAIQGLLEEQNDKLVRLAKDIIEHGMSPIDLMLVMPTKKSMFVVLEGNRRLAALKLLANPGLAAGHPTERRFRELAAEATDLPEEVQCSIVASREEAHHWQVIKHRGESEGAGTVRWGTEQQQRFSRRTGTQTDRALAVLDACERSFVNNDTVMEHLDAVRRSKVTTFGRLMSDPYVRDVLGLEFVDGELLSHYSAKDLEEPLGKVLADLNSGVTVSDLKLKEQRRNYIDGVKGQMVDAGAKWNSDPAPLRAAPKRKGRRSKKTKRDKLTSKRLFADVELTNLGSRVSDILREVKTLDVDQFPNAAAVLVRVVLDVAVTQVYAEKGWKIGNAELKTRVKKCLREIDPTDKDPQYEPVRKGLADGTSVLAVATMHGYVHNPHHHPTGTELRSIAANYAPFLQALDGLV